MKNLFILHTQYNIILGSAVALNKCKEDCNDLIVYAEFAISEEYRKRIEIIFNNVFYIRDCYKPLPLGIRHSEIVLWKEYNLFKKSSFYSKSYDHIFISQERPLDSMIYGYYKLKNPSRRCSDIEEDCYYSINPEYNDIGYLPPKRRNIIHRIRKLVYGKKYLFDPDVFFYGLSRIYEDYYVIYPQLLRPQLVARKAKAVAITNEEIIIAVNAIYGKEKTKVPKADKYYLFFFDLIERYKDPEGIKNIVTRLMGRTIEENAVLLLKYHPRETQKFILEGSVCEIPAIVPAEKILCDLIGKHVVVFGNATTALIVANRFGFQSFCIARINGSDNKAMLNKFIEMGINVPNSLNEI